MSDPYDKRLYQSDSAHYKNLLSTKMDKVQAEEAAAQEADKTKKARGLYGDPTKMTKLRNAGKHKDR